MSSTSKSKQSQRLLLKISGEGFSAEGGTVLDTERVRVLADQLKKLTHEGIQVATVIGAATFCAVLSLPNWASLESLLTIWGCLPQLLMAWP